MRNYDYQLKNTSELEESLKFYKIITPVDTIVDYCIDYIRDLIFANGMYGNERITLLVKCDTSQRSENLFRYFPELRSVSVEFFTNIFFDVHLNTDGFDLYFKSMYDYLDCWGFNDEEDKIFRQISC